MAEPLDGAGVAGSAAGCVGAVAWFARERGRRAQQLVRIEREGDLADLEVNARSRGPLTEAIFWVMLLGIKDLPKT